MILKIKRTYREPVIQEQQMSSFGKSLSLIMTFTLGYCEVLNIKLNIWLDIPRKYIEDFYDIVCVIVGRFSKGLTDTCCQDFSLWFLAFL